MGRQTRQAHWNLFFHQTKRAQLNNNIFPSLGLFQSPMSPSFATTLASANGSSTPVTTSNDNNAASSSNTVALLPSSTNHPDQSASSGLTSNLVSGQLSESSPNNCSSLQAAYTGNISTPSPNQYSVSQFDPTLTWSLIEHFAFQPEFR